MGQYLARKTADIVHATKILIAWEAAVMDSNGKQEEQLRQTYLEAHSAHLDAQMVAIQHVKKARKIRDELDQL